MNRYMRRHIALRVGYFGWRFHGLAIQTDDLLTVEGELIKALIACRLIEKDISTCNFARCGRTDKGVSAHANVVSLCVRSALNGAEALNNPGMVPAVLEQSGECDEELDYCHIINKLLPRDVRVLAWAPVDASFSARFSCLSRSYKYFICSHGLDVGAMRAAARALVGVHDFRNFCKPDFPSVKSFVRRVTSAAIEDVQEDLVCFNISGNAFLWHQIRFIMSIVILVGRGKESPGVVSQLLDVETNPRRPLYQMESEIPLVLATTKFEALDWVESDVSVFLLHRHLQEYYDELLVKAMTVKGMLDRLPPCPPAEGLGLRKEKYTPLMKRSKMKTMEEQRAVIEARLARKN